MLVTAPHLPQMMPLVMDNGRGKLSTFIDLREASGRETLSGLARDADIFVQGYRPGAVKHNGFGPEEVARLRPGIVYVSLCAYGHEGPWAGRRGFDLLVQNANGINHAEAEAAGSTQPKPLPCQAIDHASGYLMAFGAMTALARRATEGGSWHVRVSLAQTGHWMRGLGRIDGLGRARSRLRRRAGPAGGARVQGSASSPPCVTPQRCRKRRRVGRGRRCRLARMSRGGLNSSGHPGRAQREPGPMKHRSLYEELWIPGLPSVARDDSESFARPQSTHLDPIPVAQAPGARNGRTRAAPRPTSAETARQPPPSRFRKHGSRRRRT